ncbi:MAG: hypothetical protein MJ252_15685 [archaeon]|nr:hypothetical protein [archaeon]
MQPNFELSEYSQLSPEVLVSKLQTKINEDFPMDPKDSQTPKASDFNLSLMMKEKNYQPLEKMFPELRKNLPKYKELISLLKAFCFDVAKRICLTIKLLTITSEDESLQRFFIHLSKKEGEDKEMKYVFQKYSDYEDALFIMGDYLSANDTQLFDFLRLAVENNVEFLYPILSVALHNLCKGNSLDLAEILIKYMVHNKLEVSTSAINNLVDVFCKNGLIEKAQTIMQLFIGYEPELTFNGQGVSFKKYVIGTGVNLVTYGTFIRHLCKTGNLPLALSYYDEVKSKGMLKDEIIYNLILDGCSKNGDINTLRKIYQEMLDNSIKPTTVTFNTIIDAYIRSNDLGGAWNVFGQLDTFGLRPDNFTLSTLFRGLRRPCHRNYLLKGMEIIKQMNESNDPNTKMDIILINVIIDSAAAMKEKYLMVDIFNKVCSGYYKGVTADLITYNTFLKGCSQMKLMDEAQCAFQKLLNDKNVKPNDVSFNTLIDYYVRNKDMTRAYEVIGSMKERGIRPDNFTYSTIIKGLSKSEFTEGINRSQCRSDIAFFSKENQMKNEQSFNLAMQLFDRVKNSSKPDEILYNCIMDTCLRFEKYEKMFELYDQMIKDGIKPSSITCGILIKGYGLKGELKKAIATYEFMISKNIPVTSVTYGCLINACIKNNDLSKAFDYYELLKANGFEMNTILLTTMIKAFIKTKNLNKVLEIFNQMKQKKNTSPNTITYNSVIDCCLKCSKYDKAEELFQELRLSMIVRPDLITYSTIIKGFIKGQNIDKALKYFEIMLEDRVKPDEVLLNTLLDGCLRLKRGDRAMEVYKKLTFEGVTPTMMTYSILMKILSERNDYEGCKELMGKAKQDRKNLSLIIFTCFIKICLFKGDIEEALKSFKEMKTFNIFPDDVFYNTFILGVSKIQGKIEPNLIQEIIDIVHQAIDNNILLRKCNIESLIKNLKNMKYNEEAEKLSSYFYSKGISAYAQEDENQSQNFPYEKKPSPGKKFYNGYYYNANTYYVPQPQGYFPYANKYNYEGNYSSSYENYSFDSFEKEGKKNYSKANEGSTNEKTPNETQWKKGNAYPNSAILSKLNVNAKSWKKKNPNKTYSSLKDNGGNETQKKINGNVTDFTADNNLKTPFDGFVNKKDI